MNEGNLVARHNGNTSAVKHGLHARPKLLADEIDERVRDLSELPWATNADRIALEEIGRLLVLIERVDADLERRALGAWAAAAVGAFLRCKSSNLER